MTRSFQEWIQFAVAAQASDVHVVPEQGQAVVRLRVAGQLRDVESIPTAQHERLLAQIRVACQLDVSQRALPQDGRFQTVDGHSGRVSIVPSLHGSVAVLRLFRLLDADRLTDLGMSAAQASMAAAAVAAPFGLVVAVGPTGSGKTTTLYHLLKQARRADRVLVSLEDPVEASLDGVRQMACRPELGLDFAAGLRALMRQDPDVILLGEIRDAETAQIAIRAAMTGHLVLTSIHARDAIELIFRLIEFGIPAFQISSSLVLGIAQQWALEGGQRRLQFELLKYPDNLYDLLGQQPSLAQLRAALQGGMA